MASHRVSYEIEVEADSPLEAAKIVAGYMKDEANESQLYVQNAETNVIYSVDLSEDDEDAVLHIKEYEPLILGFHE